MRIFRHTKALPSLIEIFHQLDADKSGQITHEEVGMGRKLHFLVGFWGMDVVSMGDPQDPKMELLSTIEDQGIFPQF